MKEISGWEASNGHIFKHKRDAQREELDILLQDYCEKAVIDPTVGSMIDCMMAQPGAFIAILQEAQQDMIR